MVTNTWFVTKSYHDWQQKKISPVPELCYAAPKAEIAEKNYSLVPSRYIEFVEGFPMNAAGKILKYKMREEATKRLGLENAAGIDTAKGREGT